MLTLTSTRVVLPGQDAPSPATIEYDGVSGKITRIYPHYSVRSDYASLPDVAWIDAGDLVVFPGIIE
jgi:dihydroorotase-like cyclic amidohydrolase